MKVLVLGAGPAGVRAAMRARELGGLAVENALDARRTYSREIVPSGSFTDPEYAGWASARQRRAPDTTARQRRSLTISSPAR